MEISLSEEEAETRDLVCRGTQGGSVSSKRLNIVMLHKKFLFKLDVLYKNLKRMKKSIDDIKDQCYHVAI